jgi:hypothetical protein
MFVLSARIWIYGLATSFMDHWRKTFNMKLSFTGYNNDDEDDNNNVGDTFARREKLDAVKNCIAGAGGSLAAVAIIILLTIPSYIARDYVYQNPDFINYGHGKVWTYLKRISWPTLCYTVLPTVVIAIKGKMRRALMRKIKEKLSQ